MVVLGGALVVVGGLVAAVTGPLGLVHGSWLAAYLVLVCGVAQFSMGTMQGGHVGGVEPTSSRRGVVQLLSLNLGNAAVVVGTLTREPFIVDGGIVFLVIAFGIALYAARPWHRPTVGAAAKFSATSATGRFLLWTYRVLLVLLVVSLPVGSVLAHLRAP